MENTRNVGANSLCINPIRYQNLFKKMNANPKQDWRKLKQGDKVQIVRVPSVFDAAHYHTGQWNETFELYSELISKQVILAVSEVDSDGRPWVEYNSFDEEGTEISHALAIDDDSWVRITD